MFSRARLNGDQLRQTILIRRAWKALPPDPLRFNYHAELGLLLDGWLNNRLFRNTEHLLTTAWRAVRDLCPEAEIEEPERIVKCCFQLRMIDWENFDGAQMRKIMDFLDLRICDLADDMGVARKTVSFWLNGTPPQASAITAFKLLLLAHRHNLLDEFRTQLAASRTQRE